MTFSKFFNYCRYRLKQSLKGESLYTINHSEPALQEFLNSGGDPNLKIEGKSLLELNYYNIEMSRILLSAGAVPSPTTFFGLFDEFRDNLRFSDTKKHLSAMLRLYLEHGANPNAVDSMGVSALRRCESNYLLIGPLIEFGAVPDTLFFVHFSPFRNNDLPLYLEMGENPNLQIGNKFLLQYFCYDPEYTQLLLKAGADTHLKNEHGQSSHSYMIDSSDIRGRAFFFHYAEVDQTIYKNRQSRLLELYLQYGSVEDGSSELNKNCKNTHLIKPLLMAGAVPDEDFLHAMIDSKNIDLALLTAEKMKLDDLKEFVLENKSCNYLAEIEAVMQKRVLETQILSTKSRVHKL